jgi:hypothetical protein
MDRRRPLEESMRKMTLEDGRPDPGPPASPPESSTMDLDDGGGGNVVPLQQQHYSWRTLAPAAPAGHGDQEEACRGVPPPNARAPVRGVEDTSCWSCCRQGPSWWGTPSTDGYLFA